MKISKANKEDLPKILEIQRTAFNQEALLYGSRELPPLIESVEDLERDLLTNEFLKAEFEGNIVGSIRAHMDGVSCMIWRLSVSPEHQGKGIGRALISEAEKCFPEAEYYDLFTGAKSESNLHLYNKLGYDLTGVEERHGPIKFVFMRKVNRP